MAASQWGIDPETGGLRKLDDEKLAKAMWEDICKSNGLPLDTPYVLRSQEDLLSDNMTWKPDDGVWKKKFIEQLEKESDQEDLSEFEREKARKMLRKMMNPEEDDKPFVFTGLMARLDSRGRLLKRKAEGGDEEAAKALAKLATSPTLF
ncbi:hypothetical protein CTI12_AA378770 [Artemisia annua]|uniref:Uncharacterized protein n=1 Tax=Artemisia annua TaxID=35608 RepID=A0A2U1MHV1_ARTAN|nr:hypothetical protein CTI12_AA378770 [Artemisia annua]